MRNETKSIVNKISFFRLLIFLFIIISFILGAKVNIFNIIGVILIFAFIILIFIHDRYYKRLNYYEKYLNVLEQYKDYQDTSVFMKKLDSKIWIRKNKPWKKLYKELYPNYKPNLEKLKRKTQKEEDRTLFDKERYYDLPNLECLQSFPSKAKERLKENWNYTANDKIYMSDNHIDHFINLCKQDGKGKYKLHQELKGLFTDDIANLVEEALKRKRNDR